MGFLKLSFFVSCLTLLAACESFRHHVEFPDKKKVFVEKDAYHFDPQYSYYEQYGLNARIETGYLRVKSEFISATAPGFPSNISDQFSQENRISLADICRSDSSLKIDFNKDKQEGFVSIAFGAAPKIDPENNEATSQELTEKTVLAFMYRFLDRTENNKRQCYYYQKPVVVKDVVFWSRSFNSLPFVSVNKVLADTKTDEIVNVVLGSANVLKSVLSGDPASTFINARA